MGAIVNAPLKPVDRMESTPPEPAIFHELANLFPVLDGAAYREFVEDIRENGVQEPIVFLDGLILDGRNRYLAARECGIEYPRVEYRGEDPLGFVISANLKRRHLTESQRAMLAKKVATMPRGGARYRTANLQTDTGQISQAEAAKALNVSERSVAAASKVLQSGAPGLAEAVESGAVKVSAAAEIASLPIDKQVEVIKSADPKAFAKVAKEARAVRQSEKKARRESKERELGAKQRALPENMAAGWEARPASEALLVGKAGEHLVCADLLMQGFNCSLASQGSPYDLVVEHEAKLLRVQVKSCQAPRNINMTGRNERAAYSFRVRDTKDGPDRADIVACVALDIPIVAYFSHHDCPSTIQLDTPGTEHANNYARTLDKTIERWPFKDALEKAEAAGSYVEFCKTFPPFPRRKFGVIYADPPWRYEPYSRETGLDRSADNHYPTMDTDTLAGIGPFLPAAEDCVLFLWATSPMLPDAMHVMDRWGFKYVSSICWAKDKPGTGYWFRNQHETLLIGVKGNPPAPAPGTQFRSVVEAKVEAHSKKPDAFAEIIESYYPTLPKIELNARSVRPGWWAWGLEAPEDGEGV
ncbi:MAG: hypothetical protein Kow0026_08480 [Oricola sp.]